jgi:DNA-directed RNA polymerase subunit RPC12/RpoP
VRWKRKNYKEDRKMEKYKCGRCGEIIDYMNVSWTDTAGTKHVVCDDCNDYISEDHDEDVWPEPEIFENDFREDK